jgi:hypothetical protein
MFTCNLICFSVANDEEILWVQSVTFKGALAANIILLFCYWYTQFRELYSCERSSVSNRNSYNLQSFDSILT